jgi:glycerophosphoryl diester phosphodiesterase
LAAYKKAIQMKADYVEFDLQMTKDGQLIEMHDETLARTTNAREVYPDRAPRRIKDFTLDEIKRLDAGSWFNAANPDKANKEYISQKVPTLEYSIWDDHEVINDFSGPSQPLTPTGLSAFKAIGQFQRSAAVRTSFTIRFPGGIH